jgi:hypothetical protein
MADASLKAAMIVSNYVSSKPKAKEKYLTCTLKMLLGSYHNTLFQTIRTSLAV